MLKHSLATAFAAALACLLVPAALVLTPGAKNVKKFGAQPNDSRDDTAAFQSAIGGRLTPHSAPRPRRNQAGRRLCRWFLPGVRRAATLERPHRVQRRREAPPKRVGLRQPDGDPPRRWGEERDHHRRRSFHLGQAE